MLSNIDKICIIGGSGTGKTTLSNNLSQNLNLPVYHIDGINYLKNWEPRDKEIRDKIILERTEESKWIIDGTYSSTLQQRIDKSDLVIFLDYSRITQVKSVMQRFIKNHGKEKEEIPGCKEKMDMKFFLFVWNWRKRKRDSIVDIIKNIENDKILIFKNRRQLNNWFYKEFGRKIDIVGGK